MDNTEKNKNEEHLLLKEIHHRVKNNLNIIIGLLELQIQNVEDNAVKEMFRQSINRIRSMAIIHEYLYRKDSKSSIDLPVYIESLTDTLISVYADYRRELIINYSMDKVITDFEVAIPVGLIVNELVTNSIKHAFIDRQKGIIDIYLEKKDKQIILTIKDNGIGIPVNLDIENSKTLGLQLVRLLVDQLSGNYKIFREEGTKVQIEIPFKELKVN
ncbi:MULTISPECIES: sensor histidine kinase [Ignavibacterium]|jgi:two-component sensor histidine kinase|uniref:sensor histidine kinase n=1 Tax=Ignavibacterium TaxID=795750 RepID=UPI0025C27357|nr:MULTISPECIES: sensor histidine kinase [Ignavibacterium]MBI5661717.1 sensor histidine kinase [Ignavibacterium album]